VIIRNNIFEEPTVPGKVRKVVITSSDRVTVKPNNGNLPESAIDRR
jgi:translation initiation factor IF-1